MGQSEAAHPIDQPRVFNCTSGCHLAFPSNLSIVSPNTSHLLSLLISSSVSRSLLRPAPPRLAFRASASLLAYSLPINLACLGRQRGVGEKGHRQRGWTGKWKRGAALGTRWRKGMNKGQLKCKNTCQCEALLKLWGKNLEQNLS